MEDTIEKRCEVEEGETYTDLQQLDLNKVHEYYVARDGVKGRKGRGILDEGERKRVRRIMSDL